MTAATTRRAALLAVLLCTLAVLPAPRQAAAQGGLALSRHAGATRVQTAAAVAATTHPDGAATVVLARADAYGDALAAAPLAAALDAPVLLTGPAALDADAAAALRELAPEEVVLVGALAQEVADAAAAIPSAPTTRRVAGVDEWSTYAAIAAEVVARTGATEGLLVEGANADPGRGWPDALAASALAAAEGLPILLATADRLPAATGSIAGTLEQVTAVGGTAALSDAVLDAVAARAGAPVDRLAGADRYATAVAVAREAARRAGAEHPPEVWVASGRGWPDAVVAGPAAAASGGVLVLADPVTLAASPATRAYLDGLRGYTATAHLVGGGAVLGEDVAHAVATGEVRGTPATPAPAPTPTSPSGGHRGPLTGDVPRADVQRPPARAAVNPAPPISAARPWSDPATWGGRLPRAGEVVRIPADRAVRLDVQPPQLAGLRVEGTLVAADIPMTIRVGWIRVTGHLALGTEQAPLTSDVTVVLDPTVPADAPGAGEGPLAVMGGTLDLHGVTPAHTWTRLSATAVAGTTRLQLEEAPGWAVGDEVVVAATGLDPDEAETRTVVAVTGSAVELDRPLAHTHWGQTDVLAGTEVRQHAEVASLSRNLRVTSTDAAIARRHGGHVMVFAGSVARIGGVELTGLGQQGVLARYPVHFHMMDSASGSWVRGAAIHRTFNRCLTLHGSDHVDVAETVGYESTGHCFFFEDGVERGNTLHCNLGLSTRRPDESVRLLESDATPATFWVTNPDNHLTGNAAAGSDSHGFWYDLPDAPMGLSSGREMDIRRLPFGTFRDNVAHTSGQNGWKDGIGIFVEDVRGEARGLLERNLAYAVGGFGAWVEGADAVDSVFAGANIGFLGRRGDLRSSTVVGTTSNPAAEDLWRMSGVGFYHDRSRISDVTFVNFGARKHPWQRPRKAIEFIARRMNEISEVERATFVNADRLQVTGFDDEDGTPDPRTAAIRDVDGTIAGAPAVLTSAHPLVHDGACTWREDLRANACPVAYERGWLSVRAEGADLGGGSLRRADGVVGALHGGEDGPTDRVESDVLLGRSYELTTERPLPGRVEVILAGDREGHVDLAIPWPHAQAFVYDGWGRWTAVPVGSPESGGFQLTGGVLRVRHDIDEVQRRGRWQRLELCAQAFCGNAGPG